MKAEADFNLSGGGLLELNQVRARAGLDDLASIDADAILAERGHRLHLIADRKDTLGGIMISHYCKNVTVENNIFVDSDESQVYLALRGQVRNVRFARNIFYYSHPNANYVRLNTPSTLDLTSVLAEFDNNLIYHAGGTTPTFHGGLGEAARRLGVTDPARATFDKWRKLGYDDGSTVADPKFLDVKNDRYLRTRSSCNRLSDRSNTNQATKAPTTTTTNE